MLPILSQDTTLSIPSDLLSLENQESPTANIPNNPVTTAISSNPGISSRSDCQTKIY